VNWPFAKTCGDGDQAAGVIGRLVTPPDDMQVRTDEDWVSPVDAAGRIPLNQDDLERNAARSERRLDGRALRTVGEAQEREAEERHTVLHRRSVAEPEVRQPPSGHAGPVFWNRYSGSPGTPSTIDESA
jgi:hypothetical protein